MSVLTDTYDLTYGDVYTINIGTVDPYVSISSDVEKLLVNAIKDLELTNYPSGLEERVKSLLKKYYAHYKADDVIYIMKEQHPIFPGHEMIWVSAGNKSLLVYFLIPKYEHT